MWLQLLPTICIHHEVRLCDHYDARSKQRTVPLWKKRDKMNDYNGSKWEFLKGMHFSTLQQTPTNIPYEGKLWIAQIYLKSKA